MTKSLWMLLLTAVLIIVAVLAGYAIQEESGVCLPERHAADQADAKYCACLNMGGYKYCKDGTWQYKDWANDDRPTPECSMSCREDHCECCHFQDNYNKTHKKAIITIPYDKID